MDFKMPQRRQQRERQKRNRAFSFTWPASTNVCKFMGTKEIFYVRKEFNSHLIDLEHQHH